MARAQIKMVVQDTNGNALRNAKVFVYEKGTTTPVADLFAAPTGGAAIAGAFLISNTQGEIEGYLGDPRDVALEVTDNSGAAVYASRPMVHADFADFIEDPVPVVENPDEEHEEDVGSIHILAWGADPLGVASSNQAFTDAAASANGDLVVGTGTYRISANMTLSRHTRFTQGAILKPDNGVVITITGDITAGLYQIFDLSLGGTVVGMKRTVAEWFGSVADGLVFENTTVTAGSTTLTINDAAYKLPPSADIVGKTIVGIGAAAGIASTTLSAAISLPVLNGILPVTDATGFNVFIGGDGMPYGLVYVNGQFVSYTAVVGNTLTGCIGGEGLVAAGTPVSKLSEVPSPNSRYDHNSRHVTTIAARLSDTSLQLAVAAGVSVTQGRFEVAGTENQAAWTRCLAATQDGGTMLFGPGIHDAARGSTAGLLSVSARRNITIDAVDGRATLRMRPNSTGDLSTYVLHLLNSTGIVVTDRIEVAGSNSTLSTATTEQLHTIQVESSRRCRLDCDSRGAYGDGIRFIGSAVTDDIANQVRDVRVTGKHNFHWRGVWQFQRGVSHVHVSGESVADTELSGSFIHCEPSGATANPPSDISFSDVFTRQIGGPSVSGFGRVAMALQGISQTNRCKRWRFNNVQFDGSVLVQAGFEDIQFAGCVVEGDTDDVAFQADREVRGLSYRGGAIRGRKVDDAVVVTNHVTGVGGPTDIHIDTRIEQLASSAFAAVRLSDTTNLTLEGEVIGIGEGEGVLVQNTKVTYGAHRNINIDCDIRNFVTAQRWQTHDTAETFEGCRSSGHRYDDQAVPTMIEGFRATSTAGAAEWLKNHRLECTFGPEVTTPIILGATVKSLVIGGNPPDRADYRVSANPEGVVTAVPGSTAKSTAGVLYVKETGTGNTGWIRVAPFTAAVAALTPTTGAVNLDLAGLDGAYRTHALTGNVTYTTSNLVAGRTTTLRVSAAALRTLTFPAWVFVGGAAPANIAAGKTAVLTLTAFGVTDADVVAAWAVQP